MISTLIKKTLALSVWIFATFANLRGMDGGGRFLDHIDLLKKKSLNRITIK